MMLSMQYRLKWNLKIVSMMIIHGDDVIFDGKSTRNVVMQIIALHKCIHVKNCFYNISRMISNDDSWRWQVSFHYLQLQCAKCIKDCMNWWISACLKYIIWYLYLTCFLFKTCFVMIPHHNCICCCSILNVYKISDHRHILN